MKDRIYHYDLTRIWDGRSTELQVQRSCRDMIARVFHRCKATSFAVPNAGKRTRWQAAQAKREGMTKGVCDLIVVGKPGLILFAEIKADQSLTPEQHDFLTLMVELGHHAGSFRSSATLEAKMKEMGFQ